MNKLFLILLCVVKMSSVFAQPTDEQINKLKVIAQYQYQAPDSVLKLIDGFRESESFGDSISLVLYKYEGNVYWHLGQMQESVNRYKQAAEIANQLDLSILKGQAFADVGYVFADMGMYDSSVFYTDKALRISEQENNPQLKMRSLSFLGHAYQKMERADKAVTVFKTAVSFYAQDTNSRNYGVTANNLANAYKDLSSVSKSKAYNDTALFYFYKAERIFNELGDTNFIAGLNMNMAYAFRNIGELEKAKDYQQRGMSLFQHMGAEYNLKSAEVNYGHILYLMGEFEDSKKAYQRALEGGKEMNNFYLIHQAHEGLYLVYDTLGDYKNAIYHLKIHRLQADSLYQAESEAKIAQIEGQYGKEKNELEIKNLAQQNALKDFEIEKQRAENDKQALIARQEKTRNKYMIAALVLIALVALGLFYLFRSKRALNQQLELQKAELSDTLNEKEALLKEIHHRVKNNLQIVSSLLNLQGAYTQEKSADELLKMSQNRIHSMAIIHEKLYKSESLDAINFKDYLENLTTHLSDSFGLEQKQIKTKVVADDINVDIDQLVPCGLIINELITNSIKHAFGENNGGLIKLTCKRYENRCEVTVSDSGPGLPDDFELGSSNSLGLRLAKGLCKQLKSELLAVNEKGATFSFKFQLKAA